MSFPIKLQTNLSEPEKMDKDLTDVLTINATLRDETSLQDPVFLVETGLITVKDVNYITVELFGRSYFVTSPPTSISTGLLQFSCHVDVISSFKDGIRANRAIIARQENNWNLYLNDGSFKVYQNPMVLTKPFPSGFNSMEFVLAVAGA